MSKSEWFNILRGKKVQELLPSGRKVITVNYDDPVGHIWETLRINEILSVPVIAGESVVGIVDVLDICEYVVHISRTYGGSWSKTEAKHLARKFSEAEAQRLINFSGVDYFHSVTDTASLEEAMKRLSTFKAHRLVVLDGQNKLVGILSQSDINRFAAQHLDKIPLAGLTIKELGLAHGCVMMKEESTLGDVLMTLSLHKLSAVALINSELRMTANFSASDLRGATRKMFTKFNEASIDFLRDDVGKGHLPKSPIVESLDNTLKDCVKTLAEQKIHRVWLQDEDRHPIGVISLTDVMPMLLEDYVPAPESV
jgi:CBS domain-containing protein